MIVVGVMVREELPRKSAGLLGFIKDKTEADVDRIKGRYTFICIKRILVTI